MYPGAGQENAGICGASARAAQEEREGARTPQIPVFFARDADKHCDLQCFVTFWSNHGKLSADREKHPFQQGMASGPQHMCFATLCKQKGCSSPKKEFQPRGCCAPTRSTSRVVSPFGRRVRRAARLHYT